MRVLCKQAKIDSSFESERVRSAEKSDRGSGAKAFSVDHEESEEEEEDEEDYASRLAQSMRAEATTSKGEQPVIKVISCKASTLHWRV
jgi:hypothetical protein